MSFERLSQNGLIDAPRGDKSLAMTGRAGELEMPPPAGAAPRPGDNPAVARIAVSLEYMLANLSQPLKVSTLSALTGFSASRFFELFKQVTGDTPLNWFIRARMEWAGALLKSSNLQIKEVAGQVGYHDPFYFSRVFKAVQGVAPSAYRAREQKDATHLDGARETLPPVASWSGALDSNRGRSCLSKATDPR